MCESHPPRSASLNRRDVMKIATGLVTAAAAVGLVVDTPATVEAAMPYPIQVAPDLFIMPRAAWGADLPPKGTIEPETVQFLLVHHTASSNTYPSGGARDVLRLAYAWHTSAEKGWPDVCYEFFVDHDGRVWEGRAGALAGPVRADATGGSQGFAQLVCLIGDFSEADPTPEMVDSLVKVLAWLANRYGIDTTPGATTSFVSRGSQRWKAGTPVTTPTIAGHRDMSYTECPGDHVYGLLDAGLRERVHVQRQAWHGAMFRAQRVGPTNP